MTAPSIPPFDGRNYYGLFDGGVVTDDLIWWCSFLWFIRLLHTVADHCISLAPLYGYLFRLALLPMAAIFITVLAQPCISLALLSLFKFPASTSFPKVVLSYNTPLTNIPGVVVVGLFAFATRFIPSSRIFTYQYEMGGLIFCHTFPVF